MGEGGWGVEKKDTQCKLRDRESRRKEHISGVVRRAGGGGRAERGARSRERSPCFIFTVFLLPNWLGLDPLEDLFCDQDPTDSSFQLFGFPASAWAAKSMTASQRSLSSCSWTFDWLRSHPRRRPLEPHQTLARRAATSTCPNCAWEQKKKSTLEDA